MNAKRRKATEAIILEELTKHGIAAAAYKTAGLSRSQYYRWLKNSEAFAKRVDEASAIGTQEMNDLGRSKLYAAVDRGESWAVRYLLSHRDSGFKTQRLEFDMEKFREIMSAKELEFVNDVARLQQRMNINNQKLIMSDKHHMEYMMAKYGMTFNNTKKSKDKYDLEK